ncbi:hypothetical protein V2J09_019318 [Rumex salicifolius]
MATTATLLLLLFQLLTPLVAGVLKLRVHECDSVNGNYTDTSPYKNNLHKLLSETANITNNYGFYNLSAGSSPDVASLISLCRGDVDVTTCHTCQLYVIKQLQNICPNQMTAIAWSDDCMVRYSNHSIFGVLEQTPYFDMYNSLFASNVAKFNQVLWQLLETLPFRASSGDSRLKFATSQADVNSTVTIYAAMQCTPDLTQKDCLKCLNDTVREIDLRSSGRRGARFLFPSCNVRYEQYKFYLSSAADFQPPFPISPSARALSMLAFTGNGSGNRKTVTILAACTGSLSMMLVWRKWNEGLPLEAVDPTILEGSEADILRCIHIGLLCVQDKLVDRPTMSSVVLLMSSESLALPLPCLPGFAVSTSASLGSPISRPAKELE